MNEITHQTTVKEAISEIIDEVKGSTCLSVERACELIVRLDDEVMARGYRPELAYGVLYDLAEHLAFNLQESGILKGNG
ncbi:MAG: hypothetical protein PHQ22_00260 [Sulfuricurvum sp.]|nr:hypothetical protein [Sulfuricurvum sp.]MDD5385610.1 hypothetical protein [Sulfuricurvum sp.]